MYWVPVLPSYGSQSVAFLWRPVGWFAERGRLTGFYMGAALALNGLIFVQMLVIKKLVLVFVFSWTFDCCQFSTAFPLHFAYLLLGAGGCFAGCVCVCVGGGGGGWAAWDGLRVGYWTGVLWPIFLFVTFSHPTLWTLIEYFLCKIALYLWWINPILKCYIVSLYYCPALCSLVDWPLLNHINESYITDVWLRPKYNSGF